LAFAISALVLLSSVPLASALVRLDGQVLPGKNASSHFENFVVKNVGTESAVVTMVGYYLPGEGIAWRDIDPDLVLVINEENVLPIPSDFRQKYDQGLRIVVLTSDGISHPIKMRPTASFIPPTSPKTGDAVQFIDNSSDADGWVVSWAWDFNGDNQTDSTEKKPTYKYIEPDNYAVTLTVTDDDGLTDTCTYALTVNLPTYTLTTSVSPPGSGSVSLNPAGGTYTSGTNVSLTASAASGWKFDHWGGDASGSSNPVTITMDSNKSVTAYFVQYYTLTTSVSPAGSGSVSPSSGTYLSGTNVSLTATPASGWRFDHWGGNASGTSNPITITMNSNKSVTAYFVQLNRPPTAPTSLSLNSPKVGEALTATASGSTDPDGDSITYYYKFYNQTDSTLLRDWSATNTYTIQQSDAHDTITVYAKAYDGYEYSGEISSSKTVANTAPTTPSSLSLSPTTIYVGNTLTASASGSTDADGDTIAYYYKFYNQTEGVVRKDWSTSNTYTIQQADAHDTIVVYAKAYDGSAYSGEKTASKIVANSTPSTPTTLTLSPTTIYVGSTLTASASGSSDADGDSITYQYKFYNATDGVTLRNYSTTNTYVIGQSDAHDTITVYARAYDGYGYSGEKTSDKTVAALDTQMVVTTPPPANVNAYTLFTFAGYLRDASGNRLAGKTVTLFEGTAEVGSVNTTSAGEWSWSLSRAPGTYTFYAQFLGDANYNGAVTGSYTVAVIQNYTLTTSVSPAGSGSVTQNGSTSSTVSYPANTVVTVQASPSSGYTFTGWSGDLTGTTNPTTITMNSNKSVTANFVPKDFTMSISPTSGSVDAGGSTSTLITTSSVNGFSGSVSITVGYPSGSDLTFVVSNYITLPSTPTSTLYIYTSSSTPARTYTITITGTSGSLTHSRTYTLTVTAAPVGDFTISVNPPVHTFNTVGDPIVTVTSIDGFNSAVSLSCPDVHTVRATFSPPSVTPPANGTATSTITSLTTTVSWDSFGPTGTYPITITGTSGNLSHSCTYTLSAVDFSISMSSTSGSVNVGGTLTPTVYVELQGPSVDFPSSVNLTASGLPTGATATFSPSSGIPTFTSTLTISTSPSTPVGTYTITITGTGEDYIVGLTHSCTYTLTVTAAPDFTMSISPTSGSVVQTTVRYYQYSGTHYNQIFRYSGTKYNAYFTYSGTNYNKYYSYSGTNYNKYYSYSGTAYNKYYSYTGYNYNRWWYYRYSSQYGTYYFWSDSQLGFPFVLIRTEYRYEGSVSASYDTYQGSYFTTSYKDGYTAWYYSSSYYVNEGSAGTLNQDTYQGSSYTSSYKDGYISWAYTGYGYWNEGSAGSVSWDTYQGSSYTTSYKDGYTLWSYGSSYYVNEGSAGTVSYDTYQGYYFTTSYKDGYTAWYYSSSYYVNEGSAGTRDWDTDQGTSDFKTYDYKDGYILWSGSSRTSVYVAEGSAGTREYTTYQGSSFKVYDYKDGYTLWSYTGYRDVTQGGSTTTAISIGSIGGFNSPVTITVAYPSGSGLTFYITSNPMQAPSSATLTIQTTSSTSVGTYTITVIGTSGSLSHSCTYILTVK